VMESRICLSRIIAIPLNPHPFVENERIKT
jgi:hypothetical protein